MKIDQRETTRSTFEQELEELEQAEKISFDEAMEIVLREIDPAKHLFAKIMMRAGAMLVLSAVNKADDLEGLKHGLSSDPTMPLVRYPRTSETTDL